MTPEVALDLFREALWLTAMIVGVLVVPSLLVSWWRCSRPPPRSTNRP